MKAYEYMNKIYGEDMCLEERVLEFLTMTLEERYGIEDPDLFDFILTSVQEGTEILDNELSDSEVMEVSLKAMLALMVEMED